MSAHSGVPKLRKPRNRATKRNVAQLGYVGNIRELPHVVLTDLQCTQLLASFLPLDKRVLLPDLSDKDLIAELKLLAGSYQSWKSEPNPSKAEAVYQLKRLTILTARHGDLDGAEQDELKELIHRPNDAAEVSLWAALLRHPQWRKDSDEPCWAWLRSSEVDWSIVSEAAHEAAELFKSRGDSANTALHTTVSELIRLYEGNSGCRARMHNSAGWPSAICRFAGAFVGLVDPDLPLSSVYDAVDRTLRKRRARARRAQSSRSAFQTQ